MKWLVPAVLLLVVLTEACVAASPLRAFTLPITGVVVGTALGLLWGNLRSARADMPSSCGQPSGRRDVAPMACPRRGQNQLGRTHPRRLGPAAAPADRRGFRDRRRTPAVAQS